MDGFDAVGFAMAIARTKHQRGSNKQFLAPHRPRTDAHRYPVGKWAPGRAAPRMSGMSRTDESDTAGTGPPPRRSAAIHSRITVLQLSCILQDAIHLGSGTCFPINTAHTNAGSGSGQHGQQNRPPGGDGARYQPAGAASLRANTLKYRLTISDPTDRPPAPPPAHAPVSPGALPYRPANACALGGRRTWLSRSCGRAFMTASTGRSTASG